MITSKEMKELEKRTVNSGVSISTLMENAGKQVFLTVKEKYPLEGKHVVIFAGHGNNGGDGFVAARYFSEEVPIVVLFFGWEEKLSEEARENYQKIKDNINVILIEKKEDLDKFHFQNDLILIDAILGTGVKDKIRNPASLGIDYFNSISGVKVAVDVPSGNAEDKVCSVDLVVTFHDLKYGLDKEKTVVVDIGIID